MPPADRHLLRRQVSILDFQLQRLSGCHYPTADHPRCGRGQSRACQPQASVGSAIELARTAITSGCACHDRHVATWIRNVSGPMSAVVLALVMTVQPVALGSTPSARPVTDAAAAPSPLAADAATGLGVQPKAPKKPRIKRVMIEYNQNRRTQMAGYSRRHYGKWAWRLKPRGVVQHFTATNSLASVFNTFRNNSPDIEFGEYPGVCSHFVIDRDGTIYQLVPMGIRCRHTVGLNHKMLGIEHVGTSDAAVMGNRKQRRASLALTTWLVYRFGMTVGDVIGHNENRDHRWHREQVSAWRCQTHGDFVRTTMNTYRKYLRARVAKFNGRTQRPRFIQHSC